LISAKVSNPTAVILPTFFPTVILHEAVMEEM